MRHLNLLLIFLMFFGFISCSNDKDCNTSEPQRNEIVINCDKYDTPIGRFNVNDTTISDVTFGALMLGNNENGNGFDYVSGDSNIDFVQINIYLPTIDAINQEIPSGTYVLRENLGVNEDYNPFDIGVSNRIIIGATLDGYQFVNHQLYYDFDNITLNISSVGNVYSISYEMIQDGNTINGQFSGELEFVNTWD